MNKLNRLKFETAMLALDYPHNMFEGFYTEDDDWAYYDQKANVMLDAWRAAMSQFQICGYTTGSGADRTEDMFLRYEHAKEDCDRHNAYWASQPDSDEDDIRQPKTVYRVK